MRNTIFILALAGLTLAGSQGHASADAKAEAVLKAAREAMGGDVRLSAVTSIEATGTHRRTLGGNQIDGETEVSIALPDKYLRSQTDQIFGNSVTVENGFERGEPIQRSNSVGGGGPNVMFRVGGPGGPDADPATLKAMQLRAQRAELARLSLGWLVAAPAFMQPTYTYAGVAESPDGRADVIAVSGQDQFSAKLFLDQQTHRPLMLTYMGRQPVMRVVRSGPGPDVRPGQGASRPGEHDPAANPDRQGAPPMVEIQVYFDDYRKVGELWLPHRISRAINGETVEDIQFDRIQVK